MIAIKAWEQISGYSEGCGNYTKAAHTPGSFPASIKRCLPPPRRALRGGLNDLKNQRDDIAGNIPAEQVIQRNRMRPLPQRGQGWREGGCILVKTGFSPDYHPTQNTGYLPRGMPTRRGQSPQERKKGARS